jgi:hypothetical protein
MGKTFSCCVEKGIRIEEGWERDAMWLTLKTEEGAVSQAMWELARQGTLGGL